MEIHILGRFYRRQTVVDKFESLVWTERFSAWGDFELVLHSTLENRGLFQEGTQFIIPESYRVMTVENIEDHVDEEGRKLLTVTGRSLELILENRLAWPSWSSLLVENPKWILEGTPKEIVTELFYSTVIQANLVVGDSIPNCILGTLYPEDTIEPPSEEITYELDPKPLYTAMKDLSDLFGLGFRIVRNFEMNQLLFDVYSGSDRTTQQSELPAVLFSTGLDNLQNSTELTSNADFKNVAYVISPVGHEIVYLQDVPATVWGIDRRVLIVKADDIKDEDPAVASARMIQKGVEELGKHRKFRGFDGEINRNSQYKYGRDYNLGDLVQIRNDSGSTTNMRVTEQIFVSDSEGDRSYPTLTVNEFVAPGTWAAQPVEQVWADLEDDDHWADR